MKNIFKLFIAIVTFFLLYAAQGCVIINEDGTDITADFETDKNTYSVGETIEFINTSEHADSYEWDFDDGYSSTVKNPTHSYKDPGTYYVQLKVWNGVHSEKRSKKIYIE